MNPILKNLRAELKRNADASTKKSFQRFFKEEVKCYGVKTPTVRRIAGAFWKDVKALDKYAIFALCEDLYRSDVMEEASVASCWIPKLAGQFEKNDLFVFKKWIVLYVDNWAKCDVFCSQSVGDILEKFPECIEEVKSWTRSQNRWMKRAAAVSLIVPVRNGKFLKDVFEIADALLGDEDDMVQKGYGWLLKEASHLHQKEVFEYVVRNRKRMPRTALRYAVELMPANMKKEAMKKD
ncbi:MAG TPA: DNA alkylation repair protein [bacterium]